MKRRIVTRRTGHPQINRCLVALVLLASCNDPAVVGRGPAAPGTERPGSGGGPGGSGGQPDGFAFPDAPAVARDGGPAEVDAGACQPITCTPPGGSYCGTIGDGCGGRRDCGDSCPPGLTCGGGGIEHLCGRPRDPGCQPIACQQVGGRLCGRVGDGCGGALECGGCPGGEMCGASIAGVCGSGGPGAPAICDNLCLQQMRCPPGQETTLTGAVFAPTPPRFGMADPLYNALVYVPNRPLAPFAPGVACDLCGTPVSGSPLTTALTGPDGKFVLRNVPAGDNIPLVIQIGRFRRQVTIPRVPACASTALDPELTRLPRKQSEGNIPLMAIATGQYDPFECVLRKVGIDESEFTAPTGNGRIHVYQFQGNRVGPPTPPGAQLVGNPDTLARYDIVLLPCDDKEKKPAAQQRNLAAYADRGGRLFLTDYSESWLRDGGPFEARARWFPSTMYAGVVYDGLVDQSFPKGQAFAAWLRAVGASSVPGVLTIHDPFSGASYHSAVVAPTQRWIHTDGPSGLTGQHIKTVQHFTFNTPTAAAPDKQCGRVVFSAFHVAEDGEDPTIGPDVFPIGCSNMPLTPQEKALEFMLFDASACVQPDTEPPRVFQPPPPAPPPPPPRID